MLKSSYRISIFSFIFILFILSGCQQKSENEEPEKEAAKDLNLDEIPVVVMDALKAKFPQAEISQWEKETEDEIILYDIEFKQGDQKFEADIKNDGTIHNWEKEIDAGELPEAARQAVDLKYPGATLLEIMEITELAEEEEMPAGYEVNLETTEKQELEVTVSAEGEILEDSGTSQPEEN
jgi:hypothetical protein